MNRSSMLVVAASAAVLAIPAAASPTTDSGPPRGERPALRAKLKRLEARNTHLAARIERLVTKTEALASENKTIGLRWNESLAREDVLKTALRQSTDCPITDPNDSVPPGDTFGAEFHGNGSLWVGMWDSNVVVWQKEPDGSIDAKFGWWRAIPGTFEIEGRRLDGPAPPLTAHIPEGYGQTGFQATGIIFPTGGCWEVTGSIGAATRLTFVTLVLGA